jgi:hypothetical protein
MHSRNCTLYAMLADILGQSARASHDKQLSRMANGTSILGAGPTNCIRRIALFSNSIDMNKTSARIGGCCCCTAARAAASVTNVRPSLRRRDSIALEARVLNRLTACFLN